MHGLSCGLAVEFGRNTGQWTFEAEAFDSVTLSTVGQSIFRLGSSQRSSYYHCYLHPWQFPPSRVSVEGSHEIKVERCLLDHQAPRQSILALSPSIFSCRFLHHVDRFTSPKPGDSKSGKKEPEPDITYYEVHLLRPRHQAKTRGYHSCRER